MEPLPFKKILCNRKLKKVELIVSLVFFGLSTHLHDLWKCYQLLLTFSGSDLLHKELEHIQKFKSAITDTLVELCVAKEDDNDTINNGNLGDEPKHSGEVKNEGKGATNVTKDHSKFNVVKYNSEKLEKIVGYDDTLQELLTLMISHKQPQIFNENQKHQIHGNTALMHGLPVSTSFLTLTFGIFAIHI